MKQALIIVLAAAFFLGCSDKKAEEKALFDDIIKVHDKVMGADEQLMKNKMQLDTIAAQNPMPQIKDSAKIYIKLLNAADASMENWMHNFNPEYDGKPHDEVMTYLGKQKTEITGVDTQIQQAIKKSTSYLAKIKSK